MSLPFGGKVSLAKPDPATHGCSNVNTRGNTRDREWSYVECCVSNSEPVATNVIVRSNLFVEHLITTVRFISISLESVLILGCVKVGEPVSSIKTDPVE